MIISHKHHFVFLKNRKTAGTSIEIMLRGICGARDVITPISPRDEEYCRQNGIRSAQNVIIPLQYWDAEHLQDCIKKKRVAKYGRHFSAIQLKESVSAEIWENYFKFTFERNPYAKIVSYYRWRQIAFGLKISFDEFLDSPYIEQLLPDFYLDQSGRMAVDEVYAYEDISTSIDQISNRIGVPLELPKYKSKEAPSKITDYKSMYDQKAIDMIERRFQLPISMFDYRLP